MNRLTFFRLFLISVVVFALMPRTFSQSTIIPPANLEPPPWPEWVLRHWVWEHEEFTTNSALALVRGYMERDIPVGATIIDSAWETGYNTFEWNRTRYPDPPAMIDALHAMDIRIFLWITSMINPEAANYRYALEHNYLLNNGQTVRWWHGQGSFLDYTNPDAVTWWHGLMDNVLALGIDGWKTDGNDPLTYLLIIPVGYAGIVWPWQYSDYYYRDFYEYTRAQLGNDRVIMSRPVDSFQGLIHLPFAPRDVCHAGWVGDQDATFAGLQVALSNMFAAARMGYVNFGSDMAGYRGRGLRDRSLFLRWIQLGALCPVMENGGNGEHRPWMYDEEVLRIYRQFVKLHHELIPYLYSEGASAYERGAPLMQPQSGTWQYLLGRSIFVAAITEDATRRTITLPPGEWIDFWNGDLYRGSSTIDYQVPLDRYSIFFRSGDIIPLHVVDGSLGHGDESSANFLTVLINHPLQEASFDLYEEDSNGATVRYRRDADALTLEMSATNKNFLFLLRDDPRPADIVAEPGGRLPEQADRDAFNESDTGWLWDASRNELWIKPGLATYGLRLRLLSSRL
jgi:alpha-glucosidase (family GH31 glycosyl hydrolase)